MKWQEEYLAELKRTTGRDARIEQRGGWYYIKDDSYFSGFTGHRKAEIITFTERLKTRPAHKRQKQERE